MDTIVLDGAGEMISLPDHPIVQRELLEANPAVTVDGGVVRVTGTVKGQPHVAVYTIRRETADSLTLELTRRY